MNDKIRTILQAGILAPSGDNTQPWRLRFDENKNELDIFIDPKADQSFFNVGQRATYLSSGALFENILIASRALEIEPEFKIYPHKDVDPNNPIASIKFKEKGEVSKERINLYPAIGTRSTNRKPYKRTPLDSQEIKALVREAQGVEGAMLSLITDKRLKKQVASLVFKADIIRVERRDLHEFLYSTIRWNQDEINKKRDGMPIRSLEAGFGGDLFLRFCEPWPVMNFFNKIGVGRAVAMHAKKSITDSGAVGLLSISGNSPYEFFNAGRALERIWLCATSLGLSMQPVTAITLFFLRVSLEGDRAFSIKHRNIISEIRPKWQSIWKDILKGERSEALLFRIGRCPSPPTARAVRKPLEAFFI